MIKFESLTAGEWTPHVYPLHFTRERTTQRERLRVGMRPGSSEPFSLLLPLLPEPLFLLYVLHTPRGGGAFGRYQSPELSHAEVAAFLSRFASFLSSDARHDLWVHSFSAGSTLVWDRHDLLYAYGPLEAFIAALRSVGFATGEVVVPDPHSHRYHAAFDSQEAALLSALPWHRTDLRPEDEQ